MRSRIPALLLALTLPLTACSLEEVQKELNGYSTMTPQEIAKDLLVEGSKASDKAKKIAWCQATEISESGLPQAVVDALLKNDGRTIVQRARSLKRPGLATKLKACITKYK